MGWSLIQSNVNGGAASITALSRTFPSPVSVGDLLICGAECPGATTLGVSDNYGNTWTLIGDPSLAFSGQHYSTWLWSAPITAGGPAFAVTVTAAVPSTYGLAIAEFAPSTGGWASDGSSSATGSGTALAAGSFATTGASDLVVCFGAIVLDSEYMTPGPGSSTVTEWAGGSGLADSFQLQYQAGIAAGSTDPGMTSPASGRWMAVGAAFATAPPAFIAPASGGAVAGGTAAVSAGLDAAPSGGIIAGGIAAGDAAFTASPSGGIAAGGAGSQSSASTAPSSGGAIAGGVAAGSSTSIAGASGGAVAGGVATVPGSSIAAASGGVVAGGTGSQSSSSAAPPSGGIIAGAISAASSSFAAPTSGGIASGAIAFESSSSSAAPSGGVVAGGIGPGSSSAGPTPSGGAVIGGIAAESAGLDAASSGGIVAGGMASVPGSFAVFASGGIAAGGAVAGSSSSGAPASGGVVGGGTSPQSAGFDAPASGGVVAGGIAAVPGAFVAIVSGGIVAGGVAIVSGGQGTSLTFRQTLESKLRAIAGLTSLVGDSIYTDALPQTHRLSRDGPALSFAVVSMPRGQVMGGLDGTASARVQLSAWAMGPGAKATADRIGLEVLGALSVVPVANPWAAGGREIKSVTHQDESDQSERPQGGSDSWTYQIVNEYNINYYL